MSSLQQPIKKIKITTDHHLDISLDKSSTAVSNSSGGSLSNSNSSISSSISGVSSSNTLINNINESIQILNLVNSVEMFSKFTLASATDILLTAKKQNYSSGSIIIDLENNVPSNSLYIVVNGKVSLFDKSSSPSSPKSFDKNQDFNLFNNGSTTTAIIPTYINSSPNSIKKRKRENSFLKQQQAEQQIRTIDNRDNTTIYHITEEDELEDDQIVDELDTIEIPHCCFQSGDHFCENSYPCNLFIAETDVELIKFNQNDFQYLFKI